MRTVIQRVKKAAVRIQGELHSEIGEGLLVLVGIEDADSDEDTDWLTKKIANLRIFDDEQGVMNRSLIETGGEMLIVSQFTLQASVRKGNRPSYIRASKPEIAIPKYDDFCGQMGRELGRSVKTGVFGADMQIELTNDGPVTILIDSKNRE